MGKQTHMPYTRHPDIISFDELNTKDRKGEPVVAVARGDGRVSHHRFMDLMANKESGAVSWRIPWAGSCFWMVPQRSHTSDR